MSSKVSVGQLPGSTECHSENPSGIGCAVSINNAASSLLSARNTVPCESADVIVFPIHSLRKKAHRTAAEVYPIGATVTCDAD